MGYGTDDTERRTWRWGKKPALVYVPERRVGAARRSWAERRQEATARDPDRRSGQRRLKSERRTNGADPAESEPSLEELDPVRQRLIRPEANYAARWKAAGFWGSQLFGWALALVGFLEAALPQLIPGDPYVHPMALLGMGIAMLGGREILEYLRRFRKP